jgi:hypothetical protein
MKVTVKDHLLNARRGKPSVNAAITRVLSPGDEIEIDGQLYKGDRFEGIDTWVKDEADNYYWSGGVDAERIQKTTAHDFWFEQLGIGEIWESERGSESRILILDTGFNNNIPALSNVLAQAAENFVPGSTTTSSIDINSHGTHCAALIAARETDHQIGVAPEARLFIGKVTENGELSDAATLKAALRFFLDDKFKFDVISISQCIIDDDPELKSVIQDHVDKKRVVVAAIGNDSQRRNSNKKRYPGFYNNCISVGACEKNNGLSNYTCFPAKVDIFCYGTDILSYKTTMDPQPLTGTSQATAIVAGICALITSCLKKNNKQYDQDSIRNLVRKFSNPLVGFPEHRLIRPRSIFDNLSKFTSNEKNSLQDFLADVDTNR